MKISPDNHLGRETASISRFRIWNGRYLSALFYVVLAVTHMHKSIPQLLIKSRLRTYKATALQFSNNVSSSVQKPHRFLLEEIPERRKDKGLSIPPLSSEVERLLFYCFISRVRLRICPHSRKRTTETTYDKQKENLCGRLTDNYVENVVRMTMLSLGSMVVISMWAGKIFNKRC